MKIIVLSEGVDDNKTCSYTLLNKVPDVTFKTDSSLLKGGKPFFVPEWGAPCMARPYVVVHLSRLGKSIYRRFAGRYYDGLSLGVTIDAAGLKRKLQERGLASDLAGSMDGGAMLGKTFDFGNGALQIDGQAVQDVRFSVAVDGKECGSVGLEGLDVIFAAQIEWLSRWMTLRQGDLLFAVPLCNSFPLEIGQRICGFLNADVVLDFNIK